MLSGNLRPISVKKWLRNVLSYRHALRFRFMSTEAVFTFIYRRGMWGAAENHSGTGSTHRATTRLRAALPALLQAWGIRSMLDIPCGDFGWMQHVDLGLERYIGADIVGVLVEQNERRFGSEQHRFLHLDVITGALPKVDLIFCRDCLVHLTHADGLRAVEQMKRSGSTYLMATTFTNLERNEDAVIGYWRPLNLERPPYHFSRPLQVVDEYQEEGSGLIKSMGLWRLEDL